MDNERQSDDILGNQREDGFSDIFCLHKISHKKSIANQSLSITTIFVSSCNGKERCVTRQNSCMGEQLPASSTDYCDVTKGPSPHPPAPLTKELEKHCVTKQRTAA